MYIITGATGNIGNMLTTELLANGKKVRAIARNAEKLKLLADKGAETMAGDLYDAGFLKQAFEGATEAFCMIPPNPKSSDFYRDQQIIADNLFEVVRSNRVKSVVLLSCIGAHLHEGAGVVNGLDYMEEKFSALTETNIVNLRPGYFMENLLSQIGNINSSGIIGTSIKGNLKIPMVATKDIAHVAFMLLNYLQFCGHSTKYVLGPCDVSYNKVTKVLGKAIGIPDLKYVELSYEDGEKRMVDSGFVSSNVAGLYSALSRSFNDGTALTDHKRIPQNSTATTIEEFSYFFTRVFLQHNTITI